MKPNTLGDQPYPFSSTVCTGGTVTVTTAGTRVQLPNIRCKKVIIQAHETNGNLVNGGTIVIGGSDVVAASATRNGYAIYATQSQIFELTNLNLLYIDSTDDLAKVTYIILY